MGNCFRKTSDDDYKVKQRHPTVPTTKPETTIPSGHGSVKSDVYGFGVVLLEILTGLIAFDPNRLIGEQNLMDCKKGSLSDKKELKRIMDQSISGQYSITSAFQVAQLILQCLDIDPKKRPSMEEVLGILEKVRSIKYKQPKVKKAKSNHQTNNRAEEHLTNNHHYSNDQYHQPYLL